MKNLAPHIPRQRMLIEGFFTRKIGQKDIRDFFKRITQELGLRTYGKPTIHATGNKGKVINQGFDAFIPLIDSGIALYVWGNANFFSTVIYTCKKFEVKKAIKFTKGFFRAESVVYKTF
ncbi:MAG: S-adenosylmethionine decarboxylase [Candidatus Micrarchaeota archaeon]